MKRVAVITGGSSGIGLCTAQALVQNGVTVYELSRRERRHEGIVHLTADVTDEASLASAAAEIWRREGRVDVLINNAGFGISGAVEFTATEDAKKQFDVNFFGMVRTNHVFLPYLRRQGFGRIVNISSVAAPIAIPFQSYYSAAKAAIDSYTLSLQNELRPYGITVCAVRPGDIKTGFTAAREKSAEGDEAYQGRISHSVSRMERDEQNGMRPEAAGGFICRAALRKRSKPLLTIGLSYKFFVMLQKLLPSRMVNWIVYLMYAKL